MSWHPDLLDKTTSNPGLRTGMHRFVWDRSLSGTRSLPRTYPISANLAIRRAPNGTTCAAGHLHCEAQCRRANLRQRLKLEMDPRVKSPVCPGAAVRSGEELMTR